MSEENVEIVRRWWAESSDWFNDPNGGDPERLAEISARYASEDVVFEEDPVWPDAGTYRGRDAILERFLEYVEVLQMRKIEIGEIIDAGDVVFLEFRAHMGLGADAGQIHRPFSGATRSKSRMDASSTSGPGSTQRRAAAPPGFSVPQAPVAA